MELYIDENFRIISDPMNKILQERKISKPTEKNPVPQERWESIGYYGKTFQAALAYKDICENEIKKQEIQGFVEELWAIDRSIKQNIERLEKRNDQLEPVDQSQL